MVKKDSFDMDDEPLIEAEEGIMQEDSAHDASKRALQKRRLEARRKLERLKEKQQLRDLYGEDIDID